MSKIDVHKLTKIFGPSPKKGLELLNQSKSKDEILTETGMTVGVNQASFSVEEGEIFVIMGLSGSGKSTLIRLLNRLIDPTFGQVWIDDEDITQATNEQLIETRRKKLGMVFQRFGLFPFRTVLANVAYGLEIQGMDKSEREEKALQAIEDVGLKGYEKSYPDQLSGGMQQRVGLARALANETDILLMDEAFSALDPLIRQEMQDELLQLQSKWNKTVVFITHDLDEALKLGDRIAIMKDGTIVQIGTAEQILESPANDYVSRFVEDVDRSKVLTASHIMKHPTVLASEKDGPRVAVRKMEDEGVSSIFVVDRERHLQGLLTIDDAIDAYKKGVEMKTVLVSNFHTTTPDTPIQDLIASAVDTKYPITVLNEGKLEGIVSRVSILSGLVLGKEEETTA
ncbi:quaternary amine ABC transporter ATP-binding protein [Salibacterium halotolerans]|uniref:Quaternary amine transport ATP-binding protein n=1 Tax=Salibacterium halotolerans TaxID=1884432 RepID=A0A1I5X1A6_9BACI|nr:glycine betaine/L-proline ABC transporter ATP-binding protein [Salibacterium halotolerans]SFQ25661.1 glycine betaine/proline transport system ATP-binding protein [Salibacterium halotolerans]